MFAVTIAAAAVQQLVAVGLDLDGLADGLRYRPSANVRIPIFGGAAG